VMIVTRRMRARGSSRCVDVRLFLCMHVCMYMNKVYKLYSEVLCLVEFNIKNLSLLSN
jgi:hypothetical protein